MSSCEPNPPCCCAPAPADCCSHAVGCAGGGGWWLGTGLDEVGGGASAARGFLAPKLGFWPFKLEKALLCVAARRSTALWAPIIMIMAGPSRHLLQA
eukprot:CAMPEP_0178426240 /NCGR_PEP_ID=MMETSP0689_2-20121128/29135_1 /TAXON_ID=160604 /ORGANISM="Amphidinium massartii, Strain CS-259" /LENGTH=96 /DNA_ID=CAMNT_0020047925 /DNA_START=184 /DNA_END=471 /DNA_ORIENTATION=-